RAYQGRLQEEINQDRENHGKKPFPPDKFDKEETKEIKESTTDRNGFVLGTIVTPGNTHDSQILEPLVEQVIKKVGKPEAVAADAAYKTPAITSYLFNKEIIPALPYTRPRTKEG
ncbi:transposase, partial [Peribacillus simplex]